MINFIKKNKNELIKNVKPNFIKNRFDYMCNGAYELVEITENNEKYYIPLHLYGDTVRPGIYLTQISQKSFDALIEFIFNYYKDVNNIKIVHSLNSYNGISQSSNYVIDLPETEDEYLALLGKKTRLHIKQYIKYIHRDFEVDFKVFDKDIPTNIISEYYRFKKETIGHQYKEPEQEYIRNYSVTKVLVLYLNKKPAAISLIAELPDNENPNVYYENFSYDKTYSKYSLGTLITYYTIKYLIENNYKKFYLGAGDYLYKKNLSTRKFITYDGIIKRKLKFSHKLKKIKNLIFSVSNTSDFRILNILGIRIKFRKPRTNCPLEINEDTRCLMVAPHPDDEIIGAGGLMIKYSNNFDCICMCSSGVSDDDDIEEAKHKSDVRIAEFNKVMETVGIKKHWIFEFYGTYFRFDKQMMDKIDDYCNVLDLKQYDYIFLPHPKDGHHEHKFVTNKLFPKIAKKNGYNPDTKIVFYEVWADMKNPNVFFDTSKDGYLYGKDCAKQYQNANSKLLGTNDYTLLDWKYEILSMYESQWQNESMFIVQSMRTKCLNNGQNPIWRFKVVSFDKYIK